MLRNFGIVSGCIPPKHCLSQYVFGRARLEVIELTMNRFVNSIIKSILPSKFLDTLRLGVKTQSAIEENDRLSRMQFDLSPAHLVNTKLYAGRGELLKSLPKGGVFVEVGVAQGEFSSAIWEILQPHRFHLIDIWQSSNPMYGQMAYEAVLAKFAPQIQSGSVVVHRKRSVDALHELPDNSLDGIYIDADHSYASVRADLQAALPKLRTGAVITGHDYIRWSGASSRFGVIEAVNEFCLLNNYELIGLTLQRHMHLSYAIREMQGKPA
jgi:hypothetical protein